MSRTRRFLGWSRCPRHLDEGPVIGMNDDHEIEEGCGLCEEAGWADDYTDEEYAQITAEASRDAADACSFAADTYGDLMYHQMKDEGLL